MQSRGELAGAAEFSQFEWDHGKRLWTLDDRGIDFRRAVEVLDGQHLLRRSDREGEARFVAVGAVETGEILSLVYTVRGEICRVISARKAWNSERHAYPYAI